MHLQTVHWTLHDISLQQTEPISLMVFADEAVAQLTAVQQSLVQSVRRIIRNEGREAIEVMYAGRMNELVPIAVDIVIVNNAVRVIRSHAFGVCTNLRVCILHDNVQRIERNAFACCESLESIHFPDQLTYIGDRAFSECHSLESVFIPPSVEVIGDYVFASCNGLKFLFLYPNIRLGRSVVHNCPSLLMDETVQYAATDVNVPGINDDNRQVNEWLILHYNDHPLIELCADPDVTDADITAALLGENDDENDNTAFRQTDLYHGALPLHFLTRYNPYASNDTILACHDAYPAALFVADGDGLTPFDNLLSRRAVGENRMEVIVDVTVKHLLQNAQDPVEAE